MKQIHNFYVIHRVNGDVVSRWDFGEDLDKAIDFIPDVAEECYQNGKHHFAVINEVNGKVYYNHRFEMEVVA